MSGTSVHPDLNQPCERADANVDLTAENRPLLAVGDGKGATETESSGLPAIEPDGEEGNGAGHEVHEVMPREQAGARTWLLYEFQYHQAAADALDVLDDTKVACVYCEWHDDHVIEALAP